MRRYCERWRKGGFHCDGYVSHVEFIDVTRHLTQGRSTQRDQSLVQSVARAEAARDSGDSIYVNPQWDEQHICVSHLVNRLFTWHTDDVSPYSASCISVLLHPKDPTGLSMTSLSALATTYFGKIHSHPGLVQKGAMLYSQALQSLRMQLECPDQVLASELLVAVNCLSTLDSVALTQSSAWLQHYQGLARIAIGYLVERKRCFLEDPAWKSIAWAGGIGSKTPIDYLHDVFCDVPGLLEDLDQVDAWGPDTPGREEFLGQVRQKALLTLEILYSWRCKWQGDNPDTAFFIPSSNSGSDGLPFSPFQTVIWFTDLYRANECVRFIAAYRAEGSGRTRAVPGRIPFWYENFERPPPSDTK